MAKVSLRIYNREIEGLIDQGVTDEAIAHCQHILKTFSKHLETYRLLGKAFLEAKRYDDAVDIFSRVLMAVPDDFVSHVGMSIMRDEENRLDDAIWHMERAFESQPSNAAIQGELQRLYGRRDGMEPPKIRMTRGALAHMYVQGELYPQAIAEIRAVLTQDPQRADMQVLLAHAYFRGGQKADASEMCIQLLKRYAYCLDANRIMVDLLPGTAGAENTQIYRTRVGELDPYANFVKGSIFQSTEVADAAVNLERLVYTGEEVASSREWGASLGLASTPSNPSLSATSSADQPDWLRSAGATDSQPAAESAEIPDFLRAAGWGESSGPEKPTSFFDDEAAANGLTPADMPEWLKGQLPADMTNQSAPQPASEQPLDTPDWLTGLGAAAAVGALDSSQESKTLASDVPDWLSGLDDKSSDEAPKQAPEWLNPSVDSQPTEPVKKDIPDWLSGLDDAAQPVESVPAAGATPDWLSGLDAPQVEVETSTQQSAAPDWLSELEEPKSVESDAIQAGDLPDWLSAPEAAGETAPVSDAPDWSSESASSPTEPIEPTLQQADLPDWLSGLDKETPAAQPADLPDWLNEMEKKEDQPVSVESLGSSTQEQDDAVAWLESLAAKHGAKPEEMVSDPNSRSETPPEWVSQAQNLNQQISAPSVESLGSSTQEQDDAVAWLESLAAKHGAKPEEMVSDPNTRSETPPEWVSQAQNLNQQTSTPSVESLGSSTQEQDDAVAWLESLAAKHGAKPEEMVSDPSKRSETPPEWVSQAQNFGQQESVPQESKDEWVEGAQDVGEQFFADFENSTSATPAVKSMDETGMWLRSLEEQEIIKAQSESEAKQGIPDWLSEPEENNQVDDRIEPAPQASVIPNWLDEQETPVVRDEANSQEMTQDDLSNWLSGLDDEPGLPFEAMSTPDSILTAPKSQTPVSNTPIPASTPDLPDWLSGIEDSASKDLDEEWQKPAEGESAPAMVTDESGSSDLPAWLKGVDDVPADDEDDTPPWIHREVYESEGVQSPMPTSPSDWHPLEPQPEETVAPVASQPVLTTPEPSKPEAETSFVPPSSEPELVTRSETPAKKKSGLPARQRQPEAQNPTVALNQAKGELDRGDIPAALDHYGKLIKKGKHLEETIRDLTESLYRYPVEVGIWQTLGDAYMRANRLKEALEAYNKAEELIR